MSINRRQFISHTMALTLGSCLSSCLWKSDANQMKITDADTDSAIGHRLREMNFPSPSEEKSLDVVIIGAGVSGLTAARELSKTRSTHAVVLEMSKRLGGNASSTTIAGMKCPLGAHYLPIANHEDAELLRFLEESGLVTGYNEANLPIYNEEHLVQAPDERLFIKGQWLEGLIPGKFMSEHDKQNFTAFFAKMEEYRQMRGQDGRWIFDLPLAKCSADSLCDPLDQVTMQIWMEAQGFDSSILYWYVDYSCRDDFGTAITEVSAWAGIHYFAARRGTAANADRSEVLTWPEGNAYLVECLQSQNKIQVLHEQLVYAVEQINEQWQVYCYDVVNDRSVLYRCDAVIGALPMYLAKRFGVYKQVVLPDLAYAPWMVANVHLVDKEQEVFYDQTFWDNVIYDSPSLGYIQSQHQNLRVYVAERVITFYWAMSEGDDRQARQKMRETTLEQWGDQVLIELQRAHPRIAEFIVAIEVKLWGHAMLKPLTGCMRGERSHWRKAPLPSGYFAAHSDMSGLSLFEEAFNNGHTAGKACLSYLGTL